jgi:cell division transport system permease protein
VGGILLTGLAVAAAGGTAGGLQSLDRLRSSWDRDTRIVAVLDRGGTAPAGGETVVAAVRALAGTGSVRHVSAADALADLARAIGPVEAGLARLPVNPVPARLEIVPRPGLSAAALRDLVDAVMRVPGVETVDAALAWVGEIERLRGALRAGGFALAAALGATALVTMGGATSLARHRRRDESAVLRLAGVLETRLRAPLVLQAAVQGAAGGALGVGALLLASEGGSPWVADWLRAGLGVSPLPHPGLALAGVLVGAGLALGLAGGLGSGRP